MNLKSPKSGSIAAIASLVVGALLLAGLFGLGDPISWIVAGLIGAACVLGWSTFSDDLTALWEKGLQQRSIGPLKLKPSLVLREVAIAGLFIGLTYSMLPLQFRGIRPVDHDHAVHFFRAWQLGQDWFGDGRFFAWSNEWFAGYPAQYLYPPGADMFVNFIRALGLGLMSLDAAYAYAIVLFWFLRGYAVYLLGRSAFGRVAGIIAGVLFMGDSAAFRLGGWVFAMEWGVWPQSFSVTMAVLAMACVKRVVDDKSWTPVVFFGFLAGASIVTHPLQLVHFAVFLPVVLLALVTSDHPQRLRAGLRVLLGLGLAGGIASFWLLPFMSSSAFSIKYGVQWVTSYEVGQQFSAGKLLAGTWSLVTFLGFFGLVKVAFERRVLPATLGLMTLTLLLTATSTFLAAFHFLELSDRFGFVQYIRFALVLKPYVFVLAGVGLVHLVGIAANHRIPNVRLRAIRTFVLVALVFPLAIGFVDTIRVNNYVRALTPVTSRPHDQSRAEFVAWMAEHHPNPREEFFRIGLGVSSHDHSLADLGTEVDVPFFKLGETPATTFLYKIYQDSEQVIRATNIRYILSSRKRKSAWLTERAKFSSLWLYEVNDYSSAPFTVSEGRGELVLKTFDDEEIVFTAKPGAQGKVRVHTSYFPRWKAYRDGSPITVQNEPLADLQYTGFITLDLKPGEYRLVFERAWPERIGWVLLALSLLISLVLLSLGRVNRLNPVRDRLELTLERFDGLAARFPTSASWLAIAALAVLVVVGLFLAHWSPPIEEDSSVVYDFTNHVDDAKALKVANGRTRPCGWAPGQHRCGTKPWEMIRARLGGFNDKKWLRCTWVHPMKGRTLRLEYSDVPSGSRLIGYYGVARQHSGAVRPVSFRASVDGLEVHKGKTGRDGVLETFEIPMTPGGEVDVSFDVSAKNIGQRHFCFHAQIVE